MEPASARQDAREATEERPIIAPPAALPGHAQLLRGTSNAAVSAWLARETATAAPASDREAMDALEKRMAEVKEAASDRSTSLNKIADDCVKDLQAATKHLEKSNENYKAAYKTFTDTLTAADERFEMEQAIVDSVQGILVAAALAVIGPEMLLVGGAVGAMEAAAAKNSGKLAAYGFKAGAKAIEGGAGEVGEQIAGKGVDSTTDPVKPSSTSGSVTSSGDKYEEAFGKLNQIIGALPKLGVPATLAKDIAVAAGDVATEAARLGAGGNGKWTAAEATEKGDGVAELNGSSSGDLLNARIAAGMVLGLKNAVVNVEIKEPDEIEQTIWTTWMASLEGGKNEVLDNDVIQDYLTGKGWIADVGYMSDSDQRDIVTQARKDWLKARGVEVPESQTLVDNLYRRETKLDELKRTLVGKHGVISAVNKVTVEGKVYDSKGMMGGQVGEEVVVSFIRVKDHMQDPGTLVAHWSDTDFEVMGNTVAALQNAGRG